MAQDETNGTSNSSWVTANIDELTITSGYQIPCVCYKQGLYGFCIITFYRFTMARYSYSRWVTINVDEASGIYFGKPLSNLGKIKYAVSLHVNKDMILMKCSTIKLCR